MEKNSPIRFEVRTLKVFAVSGDGIGAGKSTLAKTLGAEVWSLAGALREELEQLYPGYPWFSKDQKTKETIRIAEVENKTMRQVLIEHGQKRCDSDPNYWVKLLGSKIQNAILSGTAPGSIAIDDLRKTTEIACLKSLAGVDVLHFHIINPKAIPEPQFENAKLAEIADYKVTWEKK